MANPYSPTPGTQAGQRRVEDERGGAGKKPERVHPRDPWLVTSARRRRASAGVPISLGPVGTERGARGRSA